MDYRYGSHTVYQIEYHLVWVTKYRYQVLQGDVGQRVRELVRQTCEAFEIRIIKGVVSKDHVHILVSAPHELTPSEIMRRLKGRTSSKLFEAFTTLKQRYWGQHFWARGYCCAMVGEISVRLSRNTWSITLSQIPRKIFRLNLRRVVQSTRIRTFSLLV